MAEEKKPTPPPPAPSVPRQSEKAASDPQGELRATAAKAREDAVKSDAEHAKGGPDVKLPSVGEEVFFMRNGRQTPAKVTGVWEKVKGGMATVDVAGEGEYRNVMYSEEPANGHWGRKGDGGKQPGTVKWGGEISAMK